MATLEVKRGDTFTRDFQFLQDDNTTPQDLTGYAIACTIYSDLVNPYFEESLTVTVVDASEGIFNLSRDYTFVEDWPITAPNNGKESYYIYGDIQFTSGGSRVSSDTFRIKVIEDYTDAR